MLLPEADLNIVQTAWGDSGVYYCSVISSQDLTGTSEDYTELLVLGEFPNNKWEPKHWCVGVCFLLFSPFFLLFKSSVLQQKWIPNHLEQNVPKNLYELTLPFFFIWGLMKDICHKQSSQKYLESKAVGSKKTSRRYFKVIVALSFFHREKV